MTPDTDDCRRKCRNIARIDRDIQHLREQHHELADAVDDPLAPSIRHERERLELQRLQRIDPRYPRTGEPVTNTAPTNVDPVRVANIAAMDRLLAGTPLRSTGRLSITQLSIEAGVKRWHLTHQHLDLKDLFQARAKAQDGTPKAFSRKLSEHEQLKKKYADLRQHCAELEEGIDPGLCRCDQPPRIGERRTHRTAA
ncbi:hypothetical protein ACWC9R_11890 [Streptomyces sp. NPDC001219]